MDATVNKKTYIRGDIFMIQKWISSILAGGVMVKRFCNTCG